MKRKLARDFNKALDKFIDAAEPNLRHFLIERGVSEELAEAAQDFISCSYLDFWSEAREGVLIELDNANEAIFDASLKLHKTLEKFTKTIESGL